MLFPAAQSEVWILIWTYGVTIQGFFSFGIDAAGLPDSYLLFLCLRSSL